MRAEELRIGNVVGSYNTGEEEDFFAITAQNIVVEKKSNKQGYTRYRPIPLTKQWLLKFGVSHIGINPLARHVNRYELLNHYISVVTDAYNKKTFYVTDLDIEVDFVHELQNLYFALTGIELELKNAQ